jgi:hypothetical protein
MGKDSIRTIQQTANEFRQLVLQYSTEHIQPIEINLNKLTDDIRQIRNGNDFNEIDLQQLKQKLTKLIEEFDKPLNISIQRNSSQFINKISVVVSSGKYLNYIRFDKIVFLFQILFFYILGEPSLSSRINNNTKWKQNGITIAGGNGNGAQLNQLSHPYGIYVDDDNQCIYISDWRNHRIVE